MDCSSSPLLLSKAGYNVEEMKLETKFLDAGGQEEWKKTHVCTIAFLPSESTLVKDVIKMVPPNLLTGRGISSRSKEDESSVVFT